MSVKKILTQYLIPTLILSWTLTAFASLKSSPTNQGAPTSDEFIGFQWALFNSQQVVKSDLDDIHPKYQNIDPNLTLGWKNFDSQMKKDVIVAIIDSGVDSSHPDLKGRIKQGYNFVTQDPRAKLFTDDDLGHGTHLAGIIAANINNIGISGLSNRIQILPLKVYDRHEQLGSKNKNIPIANRVAMAVDYAVQQHADVILLSMGWPRAVNSNQVTETFQRAQTAGVLIVAAAGNDNHNAQIFPCAYRGVLCVGSLDIDGMLSTFSNYGGHVDLLAPGQEILSTWPTTLASSRFGPKGYELRSGTSQAAPFVAGAAAILKGIFPEKNSDEIKALLLVSAKKQNQDSRFGVLNIQQAIIADAKKFIAPVFKQLEVIEVQPLTNKFEFPLEIEFFDSTSVPEPKISSDSEGATIDSITLTSTTAHVKKYTVQGHVESLRNNPHLKIKIKLGNDQFLHEVNLCISLDQLPQKKYIFSPDMTASTLSELHSLQDFRLGMTSKYWRTEKTNQGLRLHIYLPEESAGQMIHHSLDFPGLSALQPGFNLLGGDWLNEGKNQILVGLLRNDDKGNPIRVHYFYLDENLRILRRYILDYEGVLPTFYLPSDISIHKVKDLQGSLIKVPFFTDEGLISKADVDPDPLHFEENTRQQRLYYFEPYKNPKTGLDSLRTRCLKISKIEYYVRSQLQLPLSSAITILGTLKQTKLQKNLGETHLLFSAGRGVDVVLGEFIIAGDLLKVLPAVSRNIDLDHQFLQEGWNINSSSFELSNIFQGIFSPIAARSVRVDNSSTLSLFPTDLKLSQRGEDIVGIVKTLTQDHNQISFFETTQYLRVMGQWNQSLVNDSVKILRSNFLPGKFFSQLLVPGLLGKDRLPSVIVDNSSLFSRTVSLFSVQRNNKLLSTILTNISIPNNCQMMAPSMDAVGRSHLWWTCGLDNQVELIEVVP